ncbi:Oxysterol-binding protein 3 [Yamadazyma tenuis]|uniref:Oxysterol-binding protein 3 n=1 Tax=Candida tenuis TaxID=2315449 RepID=UPI00279E9172|nr:Oxysterol-binding protein 3 [Yamadazyma tenuis]
METLEVHSKDFLIKWVNVPENSLVDWQIKPLKRSINFSIYRKRDVNESETSFLGDEKYRELNNSSSTVNSTTSTPNSRIRSSSVTSVNKITEPFYKTKSRSSTLSSNISNGDLVLVKNYNKLISDELVRGKLNVSRPGIYAFIFDNTFSKSTGKKILFSTKLLANSSVSAFSNESDKSKINRMDYTSPITPPSHVSDEELSSEMIDTSKSSILRPKNGELLQGVLLKKRRKKLQGFVKRYFILNIKYSTLSYFRVNDNKLRGQMPINQSIISANSKKLEIIIDSGMEVWDLKATNKRDFDSWVNAFNKLKKHYYKEGEKNGATYHQEIIYEGDPKQNANYGSVLPTFLFEDLTSINSKLLNVINSNTQNTTLNTNLNSISDEITSLIQKLGTNRGSMNFDSMSLFSSNEFYDAKEYIDASNEGVVQFDDDDYYDDLDDDYFMEADVYDEDDSSISSSGTSFTKLNGNNLSIIKETDSTNNVVEANDNDKDNNLYPLPLESVKRSLVIPEWNHPPSSLLSFLRKNVGKDLSSIAMPVDMNEPVTMLQKYAELIEYCDLINNALQVVDNQDTGEKILRIAAFAVSSISSVRDKERNVRKPFNPLLGETFELVREDKGIRLVSEKVCHRPPVFAAFVESKDWTLSWSLSPSQKFWGKTAEIINKGIIKLTIRSTGEVFQWSQPNSMLKNIIAGEKYSEPSSTITIKSSTGTKAVVEFTKGGMFSGRSEDLSIEAFGANKKKMPYSVFGKWTESLTLKTNTTEKLIWTSGKLVPNPKKRFGFTEFANDLVQITDIERDKMAPTDSRLRPDVAAYLNVDIDEAEKLKCELEENQRTRRKEMEQSGKTYRPVFFHHIGDTKAADSGEWVYNRGENSYWNRRSRQEWDGLLNLW